MPRNANASSIRRQILPNGITLLTESMPHVRSVALGIWLNTGSRQEAVNHGGITHFIEHMVFKGTERRSAEQIAREVDSVGGMLDAFTTKESTCFNSRVLDAHLPLAFDVKASICPPIESTARAMSRAERCSVPLKTRCSMKWDAPFNTGGS